MCDTFVRVPPDKSSPVFFGKNSDREPNEAQQVVRFPAQAREKNTVKTSFIELGHPRDIFEVILSKPFQLWGAEMGINEYKVVIGNEAVFTKFPLEKKNKGLTGMDMIRLALEISKSANEALQQIILYVEKYGQDACGGYQDKDFYYHNSFIIADKEEAYVLETAGNFWVYEKVKGYRAISNGLTIEEDFDDISKAAVDFARGKKWIREGETFSFKKAFSARLMPRLARCEFRRNLNETSGSSRPGFSVADAFSILRSHREEDGKPFEPYVAHPDSLCMHASPLFSPNQTTGSMVVELHDEPAVWLIGSSSPCLSLYKPFYFGDDLLSEEKFHHPTAIMDYSYWWQWEKFNRKVQMNYTERKKVFEAERNAVEQEWIKKEKVLRKEVSSFERRKQFSKSCLEESESLLQKWSEEILTVPAESHFFYDRYWKKLNKKAHI